MNEELLHEEEWTSFSQTVGEIEQVFGVSQSEAEVILSQAIAEGSIRSERIRLGAASPSLRVGRLGTIAPAEPIERPDTDLAPPVATPLERAEFKEVELWVHIRNEGRWIKINRADLRHWFDEPAQQVRRNAYLGKRPRIKSHLAKLYPDGVPDPAFCPRKELQRELLKLNRSLAPLDDATLKTAIDEYNADPR